MKMTQKKKLEQKTKNRMKSLEIELGPTGRQIGISNELLVELLVLTLFNLIRAIRVTLTFIVFVWSLLRSTFICICV